MKKQDYLNILADLTRTSEEASFESPNEYLQWFLLKAARLFSPDELLFMNIQYLFVDNYQYAPLRFTRTKCTPAIFNKKNVSDEYMLSKLQGVLAFFKAMQMKGYLGEFNFGLPENLLKKKFILETILIDKEKEIGKPIEYDASKNKLTLNIPNLFRENNFEKYFQNIKNKIKQSMKHYENDLYLIDGSKFDVLISEIVKKEYEMEFLSAITKFFQRQDVTKYISKTKGYYLQNYSSVIPFDDIKDLNMLIEGALLHSYFKGIQYSYQIPIMSKLPGKNYCDLGALLLTTKKPLSTDKFNSILVAFVVAIETLREFNLVQKAESNKPVENDEKNKLCVSNNGPDKTQLRILQILLNNKFNISLTTKILNSNKDKEIGRKTVVRYTKEMFLYYLAESNFDLHTAINLISEGTNTKKYITRKYKDYFLGHTGIMTVALKGSPDEKDKVKKSLRTKFRRYFNDFDKYVNENKNLQEDWKRIIDNYHLM